MPEGWKLTGQRGKESVSGTGNSMCEDSGGKECGKNEEQKARAGSLGERVVQDQV